MKLSFKKNDKNPNFKKYNNEKETTKELENH
jgi:hypothetical protein